MKTTVDLPEKLLIQAEIRAARERRSLKDLIEAGLRKGLDSLPPPNTVGPITWVTSPGGLPSELDVADRDTWGKAMDRVP